MSDGQRVAYGVRVFIYIVIVGFIFGIMWWLAGYLGVLMGPPVGPWLQPIVLIIGALVLIGFLLHLIGVNVWKNGGSGGGPLP